MPTRSQAVVVFGVTGDLARQKILPALYRLHSQGRLPGAVIGVGRSSWDDAQLRAAARKSIEEATGHNWDDTSFGASFTERLTMLSGDYSHHDLYDELAARLAGSASPVFHLAVPPTVFPLAVTGLAAAGLAHRGRIVVEKPFGDNQESARSLDRLLRSAFDPGSIHRIDHYLGKEPVEDLIDLRFANTVLEPLWNRDRIARIEVTMAEAFGTLGRAGFYDSTGAVRDVLQNHLLQVVAHLTMERPQNTQDTGQAITAALRSMRALTPTTSVLGQYDGYLDEPGVALGSTTETYVATLLEIDSPRWTGVPFLLRTGKHLPVNATEAVIELRPDAGSPRRDSEQADLLHLKMGTDHGVTLTLHGTQRPLVLVSAPNADRPTDPYERLIGDAITGNTRRFVTAEAIDEQWRIVDPLLNPTAPARYPVSSWGPAAAETLAGGWHALAGGSPRLSRNQN